ncbi:hypothetical protein [Nocardia altamirensis]|uniref:hypothetical protein n=1 Tax=Nocardia altamirensis TaxID=472158 RepID=UPI00083FE0B5|nr:hypothetical protein [Nocardia altamirensis]
MTLDAYLDGSFLDIPSRPGEGGFSHCDDEGCCDVGHPDRIICDPNGHQVIEIGDFCRNCAGDRLTHFQHGSTLETYVVEWLSLAEGKRIVWKDEDRGYTPTRWSCQIVDFGPTCGLSLDLRSLPDYAYAVIPNDVESCFRLPADLTWTYFEDWLRNTHGIPLVSLRPGYQSAA